MEFTLKHSFLGSGDTVEGDGSSDNERPPREYDQVRTRTSRGSRKGQDARGVNSRSNFRVLGSERNVHGAEERNRPGAHTEERH